VDTFNTLFIWVPSFSYDFHKHPLPASSIKFTIKDLFPRTEIQSSFSDGYYHFATHHLPFEMCIRVVFPGAIVPVFAYRFMWRQSFEPFFIVVVQASLIVIDKDGRRDVHGIYQAQPIAYAAIHDSRLNLGGDI
jgi:hypothetical protein